MSRAAPGRVRALVAGALALAGCTAAPPPPAPSRAQPTLVSLNPCTDAILVEVADPGQILALSAYSRDPAASSMDPARARGFRSVGAAAEDVAALSPDTVVAGTFIAPPTAAAFARLGYRLELVPIARTVAESRAQVRRLARLAGHPQRGEALVRRIDAALARDRWTGPAAPALVWQAGGMVPGADTLIDDLLRRTGFSNAAAAREMKQADLLPLEQVLADPPRVILAAGNAQGNEDRALRHPALRALAGTAQARLDPALLWCGGPTIIRAADRLAQVRRSLGGERPGA